MITVNLGLDPVTRDIKLLKFLQAWKDFINNNTMTFLDFQGTAVHFFANYFEDNIDDLYVLIVELAVRQDEYWKANSIIINGALGSSLEGWINRFEGTGLCEGIDIIGSDDPRAVKKWTSADEKLRPGEIVIYFDELKDDDKEPGGDLHTAFLQCKNIAEPTKHGGKDKAVGTEDAKDTQIDLYFSNGQKGLAKYFNIKKADYTELDARVTITYDSKGLQYPEKSIMEQVKEHFKFRSRINRNIYPSTLIYTATFEGVKNAKVELKKSTEEDNSYNTDDRIAELGERFVLKEGGITVVQKVT